MIKVQIGNTEKEPRDVRESWINEQLNRRRREGQSVCVRVTIDKPPLNMVLSTPECSGSSGGRAPKPQEQRIFELWERLRLNTLDFTGGNLVAFLKQVS